MSTRPPLYVVWFVAAMAIHALLLFGLQRLAFREAAYSVAAGETVDLELVESAPEQAPANVAAPPPSPEPESPEPEVVPPPPEPKPEPTPEPAPVSETPKPELTEPNPNAKSPKPKPNPQPRGTAPQSKASANSAPAAAAAGGQAPGSGVNVQPAYLYNPHPLYPAESREKGEQGLVLLTVAINEQGNVTSLSVRQGSGYPRLDSAACEGVRSWRFRPARLAGLPIATTLAVPIRFHLGQ